MSMEGMGRSYYLAVSLKVMCDPNILLSGPESLYNDPPPILPSDLRTEADIRNEAAENEAAVRKTNEANEERRKNDTK